MCVGLIHKMPQKQKICRALYRLSQPKKKTVVLSPRKKVASGFTLIELLVCIAIIASLVALLLPAISAVRQSASRTLCENNLRQIGLALHHYHDTNECLPVGCIEWRGWNQSPDLRQYAWSAILLPYLEEGPVHDAIDWSIPFDAVKNRTVANTVVSVYLCPTDAQGAFRITKDRLLDTCACA